MASHFYVGQYGELNHGQGQSSQSNTGRGHYPSLDELGRNSVDGYTNTYQSLPSTGGNTIQHTMPSQGGTTVPVYANNVPVGAGTHAVSGQTYAVSAGHTHDMQPNRESLHHDVMQPNGEPLHQYIMQPNGEPLHQYEDSEVIL